MWQRAKGPGIAILLALSVLIGVDGAASAQQRDTCIAACQASCSPSYNSCRRTCSYPDNTNATQSQIDACIEASCKADFRLCEIRCRRNCPEP